MDTFRNSGKEMPRPAIKLVLSYVFDWVIIVAFAAAGGGLSFVKPNHRPFSLVNLDISYPYIPEQIKTWILVVVALGVPALLIALITLIFVPGSHVRRISNRSQILRLKLWELEKGLAGLCLSVAVAFFITQGMKNLFGKPRPDLLARCQPSLSNIAQNVVGGYGQDISARWTLVTSSICTQTDTSVLDDGFRSFPSGHASWSWSGLLYLTLYLCSKFAIAIPYLPVHLTGNETSKQRPSSQHELLPLRTHRGIQMDSEDTKDDAPLNNSNNNTPNIYNKTNTPIAPAHPLRLRNAAASPPNYLIIPALLPVGVAVYICSTRFAEYYHFGFDVIFGSLIGIATAYLAFRWYHLPLSRGEGWAWGARDQDRAWGVGVGTGGYVDDGEGTRLRGSEKTGRDVEAEQV